MRRYGALSGALLLVGCEVGAVDVPIGADVTHTFYLSPDGSDDGPGSRDHPWRTFAHATGQLRAGQTLLLLDGDYDAQSTGLLQVDCDADPRRGNAAHPITVRAESERQARLHGDGDLRPLDLRNCAYWRIEGLTLSSEHQPDVPEGTDVGSVAMVEHSHDVELRRLLLLRPNHYRHTHLLRVLEAERVLVEECEGYDFFHNAFETVRSHAVTFRRNYFHSRYAVSPEAASGTDDPTRGEVAIQVEESSDVLLENNVAEVVGTGFGVVGRPLGSPYVGPPPRPVSAARLLGNVVRDALAVGFKLETRCNDAVPCTAPENIVTGTSIRDGVVDGAPVGVSVNAAPDTRVEDVTLVSVTDGVALQRSAANQGLVFSATVARTLVRGFSGVAFAAQDAADWSFERCAALEPSNGAVRFSPNDARVREPLTVADAPCSLPAGARVARRYLDGVLTDAPLWDARRGAFPCGAVVPGLNDDASESCAGVHERLRAGNAGCALEGTEAP